jgi:hypothetical protein
MSFLYTCLFTKYVPLKESFANNYISILSKFEKTLDKNLSLMKKYIYYDKLGV